MRPYHGNFAALVGALIVHDIFSFERVDLILTSKAFSAVSKFLRGKTPTYYPAKFFRKLHKNEDNWAENGGAVQNVPT